MKDNSQQTLSKITGAKIISKKEVTMAQNIKEKARERMELRIHAKETLGTLTDWIRTVAPSTWLPTGKESPISDDELKAHYRDYVDEASKLIKKCWKPAELLVDDLTSFMEEICAKPKETSESK